MSSDFGFHQNSSIILVGLMGAGKTTIGKKLAEYLTVDFFDSDEEVEKAIGKKISTIFSIYGEKTFRIHEKKIIKR